ncbi:MAG TPA: hypothetical protein PLM58_06745, partial [Novosphingobium sp.]|nr:hypothetical protein [Novosphingobium sp.]
MVLLLIARATGDRVAAHALSGENADAESYSCHAGTARSFNPEAIIVRRISPYISAAIAAV